MYIYFPIETIEQQQGQPLRGQPASAARVGHAGRQGPRASDRAARDRVVQLAARPQRRRQLGDTLLHAQVLSVLHRALHPVVARQVREPVQAEAALSGQVRARTRARLATAGRQAARRRERRRRRQRQGGQDHALALLERARVCAPRAPQVREVLRQQGQGPHARLSERPPTQRRLAFLGPAEARAHARPL